jgi:hypothetical protein
MKPWSVCAANIIYDLRQKYNVLALKASNEANFNRCTTADVLSVVQRIGIWGIVLSQKLM